MAEPRKRLLLITTLLPLFAATVGGFLWGSRPVQALPKTCWICSSNTPYTCIEIKDGGFGKACKETKSGCDFTGLCGQAPSQAPDVEAQIAIRRENPQSYRVIAVSVD